MRSRIRRIQVVLLLLYAVLFSGCMTAGPRLGPSASPSPAPSSRPSPEIASGPPDTLRWSIEGIEDAPSLDPAAPINNAAVTIMNLIYGGLIRLDQHLEVQPDGAERWEVSPDGRVYTFTIREGLRFADGTPVTAQDFVYSINRALAPETASFGASAQLSNIVGALDVLQGRASEAAGVRALDERTLEVHIERPQAYFLSQLSYTYAFLVPRSLVESGEDWQQQAYGTGPFRVKEWHDGESLVLEANPHYWRGDLALKQITVQFYADSAVAFERYKQGEIDIMGSQQNPLPAAFVAEVEGLKDFRSSASLTTRYVGFNNRLPPFDNEQVRRALALAVDKEVLSREVLSGTVIAAQRILPEGLLGTELPIRPLSYDPAAARRELDQAGYPAGAGFPPVRLAYAREGDNELVAEALQRFWRESLQIEVALQPYDLEEFVQMLDTTYLTPTEGLQVYLSVWGADYPDPQNFLSQQLHSDSPNNNGHFSDPVFDQLVEEADRLAKADEVDRRLQLYNQAEQIAIDKVGWLPLYYPRFNTLLRPDVEGLMITPNGIVVPDWTKVRRQ